MALRNDTDRQYVNGSLGTVRGFAQENKGGWPIVEFENGNIVTMKQATWEMMDGRHRARLRLPGAVALRVGHHHPQVARHDA